MIDFSKAFNKILRSAIKESLNEAGVSKKLIWKILKLNENTLLRVGDKNIKTKNGVRQGCCLSATLFIAVMALLTKGIPELHLVYADDLCIVIDENMDANSVINWIKEKKERFGLIINEDKTEILELSYEAWKQGKSIKYLGATIGNNKEAVKIRINKSKVVYARLWNRVFNTNIDIKWKIRAFEAIVKSVLTYGLDCIALSNTALKTVDSFCFKKLKSILGYKQEEHVSYSHLDSLLPNWKWPSTSIKKQRAKLFGNYLVNEDDEIPDEWKRPRGKQPTSMRNLVMSDLKLNTKGSVKNKIKHMTSKAKDEEIWKSMVNNIVSE